MPVYRIIGKKWTAQLKIVQTVESGKGLRTVLPSLSKKLQIPSMKFYNAYKVNAEKQPILQLDLDASLEEQNVGPADYIYVAPQDTPPSLPNGDPIPLYVPGSACTSEVTAVADKESSPTPPPAAAPPAPAAAPPPPPPPTSKLPPPPPAAAPPAPAAAPPPPRAAAPSAASQISTGVSLIGVGEGCDDSFGITHAVSEVFESASPISMVSSFSLRRIKSFGPMHATEQSKRKHVISLPSNIDDVSKSVLQRLETALLRELPEDAEEYLFEKLSLETGLSLSSLEVPKVAHSSVLTPHNHSDVDNVSVGSTMGKLGVVPLKHVGSATLDVSPNHSAFVTSAHQGKPSRVQSTSASLVSPSVLERADAITKAVLRKLDVAVMLATPDDVEEFILSKLSRETGLRVEDVKKAAELPISRQRTSAPPLSTDMPSPSSSMSPPRPDSQYEQSTVNRQASPVREHAEHAMSTTPRHVAPRWLAEIVSEKRSPRELLAPPTAVDISIHGLLSSSRRRSLAHYERIADPPVNLSQPIIAAASPVVIRQSQSPPRAQEYRSPPKSGEEVVLFAQQRTQQSFNADAFRARPTATVTTFDVAHMPLSSADVAPRSGDRNPTSASLRSAFDDMMRRQAESNRRLQQEVSVLRTEQQYHDVTRERDIDHHRRMLAILAAEEAARAHALAQRRLIELSARGEHLATEIEKRASPKYSVSSPPSFDRTKEDAPLVRSAHKIQLELTQLEKQKILQSSRGLGLVGRSNVDDLFDDDAGNDAQRGGWRGPPVSHAVRSTYPAAETAQASLVGSRIGLQQGEGGTHSIPQHFTPVRSGGSQSNPLRY